MDLKRGVDMSSHFMQAITLCSVAYLGSMVGFFFQSRILEEKKKLVVLPFL